MNKTAIFRIMVGLLAIYGSLSGVSAQTLNVHTGNVTYLFPATQCGEMTYQDGTKLTILNKTFTLSDIGSITIDEAEVTENLVSINYNGTVTTVTVAGNVAQYITPTVNGAHVSITQSNTEAVNGDEITYLLSGTTSNGSFALEGSYKCSIVLDGVTLTNPSGAAISINNSKRIQISAKKGTENTLTDGSNGSQKACLYSKGQIQLQGNGTLNVAGYTKHAIKSGDYISIKNLTLNITKAVGDGISCNKYFQQRSGTINISGIGDDGIQTDLEEDDTTTGETEDHEDENSANVYIEGGTLTITNSASGGKGIKATGGVNISDGTIDIKVTGSNIKSGTNTTAAKGIKADGSITISGGSVKATASNHEAIESKSTMTITGGTVYAFSTSDDAINSASHMYLKGGTVSGISNGNDGIDANGNMYISGGTILACGAGQPECGLDAAERYALYITGGTVLGIGGGNNTVTATTGSQCVVSSTGTVTAGNTVSVKSGSTILASFTVPTGYSPSSGGGGGPGGGSRPGGGPGGGGSSSGFSYLLSCPGLTSGSSYTITIGSSSSTAKASTSYSGR